MLFRSRGTISDLKPEMKIGLQLSEDGKSVKAVMVYTANVGKDGVKKPGEGDKPGVKKPGEGDKPGEKKPGGEK